MHKRKVLVLDDMLTTREGLATVLGRVPGVEVSRICERSWDALEAVKHEHYDLAMIDLELGRENGIDLGRELIKLDPRLKVLIYTKEARVVIAAEVFRREYYRPYARRVPTATKSSSSVGLMDVAPVPLSSSGLHGYLLLKNITPYSFKSYLDGLDQHGTFVDAEILDLLIKRLKRHRLTPRELECSELISQGKSNREISYQLGITQQAVENLINSLYNKLSIVGEPKDPGRRVLLALTMQRWRGLVSNYDE